MKPKTELDLSPHVIAHLKARGMCVHGEVAMFGKSIFVDHVAHLGPCHAPTYVVAVEMKKRSDKTLRRQAWKLDIYHVADEIWGAVIATPRASTVEKWDAAYRGGRWSRQGLLSWSEDGFVEHIPAERLDDKNLRRAASKLLLVPENQDILAGYPSGEHEYITHHKLLLRWVEQELMRAGDGGERTAALAERAPHFLQIYKNPNKAIAQACRELHDQGRLRRVKRGTWSLIT